MLTVFWPNEAMMPIISSGIIGREQCQYYWFGYDYTADASQDRRAVVLITITIYASHAYITARRHEQCTMPSRNA